jgi:hypothetical protein
MNGHRNTEYGIRYGFTRQGNFPLLVAAPSGQVEFLWYELLIANFECEALVISFAVES